MGLAASSWLTRDLDNYLALRETCVSAGDCYGPELPSRLPAHFQVLHVSALACALWLGALLFLWQQCCTCRGAPTGARQYK